MIKIWDSKNQNLVGKLNGKEIVKIWRVGNTVIKKNPSRLTKEWRIKAEKIFNIWQPSNFIDFTDGGYICDYIDGTDLHGNKIFCEHTCHPHNCILTIPEKYKVLEIFSNVIQVGNTLGFTFGDITCGNILKSHDNLYLIDFDVIIDYPPDNTYSVLWDNTLNIIFNKGTNI